MEATNATPGSPNYSVEIAPYPTDSPCPVISSLQEPRHDAPGERQERRVTEWNEHQVAELHLGAQPFDLVGDALRCAVDHHRAEIALEQGGSFQGQEVLGT